MSKTNVKSSTYEQVTQQIIEAIEAGVGIWRKPWDTSSVALNASNTAPVELRPQNVTGRAYRGINIVMLWAAAQRKGYATNLWGTYKQWQAQGAQVRKGEKAAMVVFWKPFEYAATQAMSEQEHSGTQEDPDNTNKKTKSGFLIRVSAVFNLAQVDGYKPAPVQVNQQITTTKRAPASEAEAFFQALGGDVRYGGNKAYYDDIHDYIQMPVWGCFYSEPGYYTTLAHETVHWTAHYSRLDRDLHNRFGSEAYAAEELIAELGSAFLCADLGINSQLREDHAAYIGDWLRLLKSDSKAIFTAAAKAQAAVDWLHDKAQAQQTLLCA